MNKALYIIYCLISCICAYCIWVITPSSNWMGFLDVFSTFLLIGMGAVFVIVMSFKYYFSKDRTILKYLIIGLIPLVSLPFTEVNFRPLTQEQQLEYDRTMNELNKPEEKHSSKE